MGHFSFWQGMEPAPAASLSGASSSDAAFCIDPSATYASALLPTVPLPPALAQAEPALRREEMVAINLIATIVQCSRYIESGDYATAAGFLAEARVVLATVVPTATGIGRVASHFAAALARRLFPASPHSSVAALDISPEQAGELYRHFYDAGPYLKFAHFAANQAILEAFDGCDRVHIVDFAIMQGVQWPALIQALSVRPGGPPTVRLTGVGSSPAADEMGVRLTELARAVSVPFSFQRINSDSLDALQPWMFQVLPGEVVAVNSICQLHQLLVDPDAASTSLPKPIDVVLGWVTAMQPRVFTVVEQEADLNKPSLEARLNEALFYYAGLFDSMEAMAMMRGGGGSGNGAGADAYVQREIFDVVCGEGIARKERHETLASWYDRFCRAGLTHVQIGPSATNQASMLVHVFSGAGFRVVEIAGCLVLFWHERPLLTASVWRATPLNYAGKGDMKKLKTKVGEGSSSSSSSSSQGAAGGMAMQ